MKTNRNKEGCNDFVNVKFKNIIGKIHHYVLVPSGAYTSSLGSIPYPCLLRHELSRLVFNAFDVHRGEILDRLSMQRNFQNVNQIRVNAELRCTHILGKDPETVLSNG